MLCDDLQTAAAGLPLFQFQISQDWTAGGEAQALPGKLLDASGMQKLLPAMIAVGQGDDQDSADQNYPPGVAPFRMVSRHREVLCTSPVPAQGRGRGNGIKSRFLCLIDEKNDSKISPRMRRITLPSAS
ncbi:hypothetical protein ACFS3C_17990 [Azotobacter vinelandii]